MQPLPLVDLVEGFVDVDVKGPWVGSRVGAGVSSIWSSSRFAWLGFGSSLGGWDTVLLV